MLGEMMTPWLVQQQQQPGKSKQATAFSADEADALVVRVDARQWQLGFGGEDAPRWRRL